ncbi:hypothetical protein MVEN_01662100 [Mycena venus]|uniref:Uncharacterized protein n=1 Tax=Mycena venus TaxID=2733690 RepID=A0A8H6XPA6_9AGAR|nr:hypothetical protein MVEN_01662100 [Mycena venus]
MIWLNSCLSPRLSPSSVFRALRGRTADSSAPSTLPGVGSFGSFINRHTTLTSLDLFRSRVITDLETLSLPHLKTYSGTGRYASGLVVTCKSLETITVTWQTDDSSISRRLAPAPS